MSHLHGRKRQSHPGLRIPSTNLDTIQEGNIFTPLHSSQRSSSSSRFGIFSERHLETIVETSTFTPLPFHKFSALPPANQEIIRNNNFAVFDQVFSFRRLDWLIHDESLFSMLEEDELDFPQEDLIDTMSQIVQRPRSEGTREDREETTHRMLQVQNYEERTFREPEARRDGLMTSKGSPTLECSNPQLKTAVLIPWKYADTLRNGLERIKLQRVKSARSIGYANAPLQRQGSIFGRLRRFTTSRTVPTQARYVKFESQRKKEGRDTWSKIKGWIGKK